MTNEPIWHSFAFDAPTIWSELSDDVHSFLFSQCLCGHDHCTPTDEFCNTSYECCALESRIEGPKT